MPTSTKPWPSSTVSHNPADPLRLALREPAAVTALSLREWDLLIRQARRAGLLGRLACALEDRNALAAAPAEPRRHLVAEQLLAEKHVRDVRWEVRCIAEALSGLGLPVVLLKGAAYVMAGLPAARGRLFGDVDIMVPQASLAAVEAALIAAGWRSSDQTPYDERYYRRWMHQIPPMTHISRGTAIDVHHTIVARTTRFRLDAEKLFAAAVAIPDAAGFKMLAPADMVLHSATHLLNEGDFDRGLRDLDDINLLLRHFGTDADFWPHLLERAQSLDLRRPLFYALRYATKFLDTPVPEALWQSSRLRPPGPLLQAVMDPLFDRALRADHASCRDRLSPLALFLLYIRGHHLLMPTHTLIPHLLRKAMMRTEPEDDSRPGLFPQR